MIQIEAKDLAEATLKWMQIMKELDTNEMLSTGKRLLTNAKRKNCPLSLKIACVTLKDYVEVTGSLSVSIKHIESYLNALELNKGEQ